MDLFEKKTPKGAGLAPLAARMRAGGIKGFAGQEHLLGEGKFLRKILLSKELPSMILWGPPGCGKTTLARIMAKKTNAEFVSFSAVLSGVKEIRDVVSKAKEAQYRGKKTILFVDEIHRFNKSQQDAFLHSVEDGTITLIGATTENPSFEVNAPLLSRCKVLTLKGLAKEEIKQTLRRAAADSEKGLGSLNAEANDDALDFISEFSHGDMREALNSLENACVITSPDKDGKRIITIEAAKEAMQKKSLLYDKSGEEHYNVISAFIKSMRGSDPDAALYWLWRMPEGWIPLAHGVTYLSTAPKSNASYTAYLEAKEDVNEKGALPVPLHLRNAPTSLMKDLGYGKDYKYPHNYKDAKAEQDYLPEVLKGKKYYTPPEKKKDK